LRKYVLNIKDREYKAEVKTLSTESAIIIVDEQEYKIDLKDIGRNAESVVKQKSVTSSSKISTQKEKSKPSYNTGNEVLAPLPGLILEVLVSENAMVKSGQAIAVMEAMKMENQIQAPHDGTVKKVLINKDDSVMEGDILFEIERSVITSL